ncbi:MAG: hypothetical protein WC390_11885 [Sulfurimonas sp.]|jgi:predicted Rossmann fold nucleotide-binding protein DprA/Smf involved in DNA uptake
MNETKYNVGTTIIKTVETPAVIIVGSKVVSAILTGLGAEIDSETVMVAVTAVYGVVRGIANWIKNRRKGK